MLISPSTSQKSSMIQLIINSVVKKRKWADQASLGEIEDLRMTGDIILLGEFPMKDIPNPLDGHDIFREDLHVGIFIARLWTEMTNDGIGMFFEEGSLDLSISPIVDHSIEDESGNRIGTVIAFDHDEGTLFVAVEMVGTKGELERLAEEHLLWPDIVIRAVRCPKCGVSSSNEDDICPHLENGSIKPIIRGYADRIVLKKEHPDGDDIKMMFIDHEEFLDLQPVDLPNSSRRISANIELFRFVVTDQIGSGLFKIGPYSCSPGRELILSRKEIEDWIMGDDYEDGLIVFLGTINGETSKAQVEEMIMNKAPIKIKEEVEYDGAIGFEFPE